MKAFILAALLALNPGPEPERWLQGYAIELCPDPPNGDGCRYHPRPDETMARCKLRIVEETFNTAFAGYKIRCVYVEGWYK